MHMRDSWILQLSGDGVKRIRKETNQKGGMREGNFERGQGREASLLEFIFVGSEISAVFALIIAC